MCAAKKHHPDVNPGDVVAAERFKRMTSSYTQALLLSAARERSAAERETPAGSRRAAPGGRTSRMSYGSPRATTGPVDERRFNVREWDRAHYGLHGATAEERQSQYIRDLNRQQRARPQSFAGSWARGGAQRRAGVAAASGGGAIAMMAIAACASVWSAVYQSERSSGRWGQEAHRGRTRDER